jgi:hypothetical protein
MARHCFTWWEADLPDGWVVEEHPTGAMLRPSGESADAIFVEAAYGGSSSPDIATLRELALAGIERPTELETVTLGKHVALRGRIPSAIVWYIAVDSVVLTATAMSGRDMLADFAVSAESILSSISADAPQGPVTRLAH